jgi:hypothetical protein
MNKMRDEQGARLMELSISSRKCIQNLDGQQKRAETILRYAELNRKLETDREKVGAHSRECLPFVNHFNHLISINILIIPIFPCSSAYACCTMHAH